MLRLLVLLRQRPPRTVPRLAAALDVDVDARTVYRYLKLLDDVGFLIDKDTHDRYFVFAADEAPDGPAPLLFTPEETALLRQALAAVAPGHPLHDGVLEKLYL
ncbi:MAG: HTH domain-containing protein, partial [Catalinimonas sp.]